MNHRNCVQQRDYVNALKLHKISSLFIVYTDHRYSPLYGFLNTHEIYSKVGFWRELLLDYCMLDEEDPSYQLKYFCSERSDFYPMNFGTAKEGQISLLLEEDPNLVVSSDVIAKGLSIIGNLMMDLKLSEENATRIMLTVLQLISE